MTASGSAPSPGTLVFQVRVVVESDGDDAFYAHCPELGCIHVSGETSEEAEKAAVEAVQSYLVMSIANGDPIPIGVQEERRVGSSRRAGRTATRREFFENVSLAAAL